MGEGQHLADRNAQGGREVDGVLVLNNPAAAPKEGINGLAGFLFSRLRHGAANLGYAWPYFDYLSTCVGSDPPLKLILPKALDGDELEAGKRI